MRMVMGLTGLFLFAALFSTSSVQSGEELSGFVTLANRIAESSPVVVALLLFGMRTLWKSLQEERVLRQEREAEERDWRREQGIMQQNLLRENMGVIARTGDAIDSLTRVIHTNSSRPGGN